MALTKEESSAIITKFGKNPNDTGNTRVQIALLTQRIKELSEHCTAFPKDSCAKRSLLKIIGQRKRMLGYFQRKNLEGYRALIKELGLRR